MKMEKFATVLSYSSSGTLMVFGVALSDVALLVGIFTGVGTFFVNWHYRRKEFERASKR